MLNKLSVSSVALYQKCPRAYDLRYHQNLRRKASTVGARDLGSAVHGILYHSLLHIHTKLNYRPITTGYGPIVELARALWAADNEPDYNVVDSYGNIVVDPADWDAMLDEAEGISLRFLKKLDPIVNYRVMEDREGKPILEYHLDTDVMGYGRFVGIVDAVWQHVPTGTIELVDFKTTSRFKQWDEYQLDNQLIVYSRVLAVQTGVEADSLVYWQIRPVAPKTPTQNKDGSMSRRAITSDWETYKAALVAAGLDPDDYADMRAKLDADDAYWYAELVYTPSDRMVAAIWEQFLDNVQVIVDARRFPASVGYNCRSCDFRDYCLAAFNGDDPQLGILYEVADATKE